MLTEKIRKEIRGSISIQLVLYGIIALAALSLLLGSGMISANLDAGWSFFGLGVFIAVAFVFYMFAKLLL